MAKEKTIECEGVIVEALPNSLFKVEIRNGYIIMCQISGKIRINNIIYVAEILRLDVIQAYGLVKRH